MSWTLILIQGKGYISKRLLANPHSRAYTQDSCLCQTFTAVPKGKSGKQNYKTGKHQHMSLQLQGRTSWPSPHTSELTGSVVNTTKMGTSLLPSSDLQISVTDKAISKKYFYQRKEKTKSEERHFLLQLSQKAKGEPICRTEKQNSCTKAGCWGTLESLIMWLFQQRGSKVWSLYIYTVALSAVANTVCLLLFLKVRSTCREEHQSEDKLNK